ncbi:hypothetical protein QRD88_09330 [Bacillus safensis]|uniref:hypothetical protein n=1 Tax=Bacillus TaxID=1386 RepID=UPI000406652C|nr:hypothetical protein [Bacillus safensis]MED4591327.1 hypothetical protein [Bacillus safensis]MED4640080.1 hypothetical protein [Bacillus safensis]WBL29365.1 hypothetical protein ORQ91_01939 [Bacillus safensis]WJE40978.1 hypothetical protein QRD88_09330 [Bacillus safensis]VCT96532.1 hypothetical protein AIDNDMCJ_05370 [Bacillus safensis]
MGTTTLCEACQKNEMNVVESTDNRNSLINYAINATKDCSAIHYGLLNGIT